MVAIGERDAAVAVAEKRAGAALRQLTNVEGLNLREAVEWCGETLTAREATRLSALVPEDASAFDGGPPIEHSRAKPEWLSREVDATRATG